MTRAVFCFALLVSGLPLQAQPARSDIILQAMRDEMSHSRALQVVDLEKPYYIKYEIEDARIFTASATLGGLIASGYHHLRIPRVEVRVGDYQFDNTNYIGSGFHLGSRYDIDRFPLENVYSVLRRFLWLATDQAYKSAVETIARKRAALKNMDVSERLADFARAEKTTVITDVPQTRFDGASWLPRVRSLSAIFAPYPQVRNSSIEFQAVQNVRYLVTSEGTEVRIPETLLILRARASGQAPDGMRVRDAVVFHALGLDRMPDQAELARGVRRVAENVTALTRAPVGEIYNGPVLFEGVASAQLFAQILGKNLALTRRPVEERGRPVSVPVSELEGRQGAQILPEWMDVVDDPTSAEWRGRPLFGSYQADFDGVAPKPLTLVERGVLKNFLLTRQPVRGFAAGNGRARLQGNFGASAAGISNLFIRAAQTASLADLKKKLMAICQARNQPYGIVVRLMDFPSSASLDEVRQLLTASAQAGGGSHPVSLPILTYRVFADGREELVRGVRFRDLNARSLRDIRAAAEDAATFDFLDNSAPFALMGGSPFVAESSVVAPSVLMDEMALRKMDEELPKLPIVPPPALAASP